VPPVQSMTGFARGETSHAAGTLCCELRSVNHRYLELQLRVPDALRGIEQAARERLRERLGRGKVDCALRFVPHTAQAPVVAIDEAVLEGVLAACARIDAIAGDTRTAPPAALELLRWPGVVREEQVDAEALGVAALAMLERTVDEFEGMREREGSRHAALLAQRLDLIETLVEGVRAGLPAVLAVHRARLVERLAELLAQPPAERLDQEIALLAARGDVAEELDRLLAHVEETRRGLRAGGACGRRLDFLMQEFNREANTLSSKSLATETTQAAVEMKVLIEQMREQVQNIE